MNILALFEQLACTAHHKINFEELLKGKELVLQKMIINQDVSALKNILHDGLLPADRTTIFDV